MNVSPSFEPLRKLFRDDTARIRQVLEIFVRITHQDLERLDTAYANQDWAALGRLAHKLRSGCHQLGEIDAAERLAAIERATSSAAGADALPMEFALARQELDRVMARVSDYLLAKSGETN